MFDITQAIIAFGVIAAAVFAGCQFWLNIRVMKAQIIADFLNIYYSNEDMQEVIRRIDSGEFTQKSFCEKSERQLNKLLVHFNAIARWWKNCAIGNYDLQVIDYHLCSVMTNPMVCKYMDDLAKNCELHGRVFPFPFLRELWNERKKRKLPYHPRHPFSREN